MQLRHHIDAAIGAGLINQDIADAGLEIALAESDQELLQAAKRYRNYVMTSARGNQINATARMNYQARIAGVM